MPHSIVVLHVLEEGDRLDGLLAAVADDLHFERLTPRDGQVLVYFSSLAGTDAWDAVHAALERADPEWQELVLLGPRRP